MSFKVRHFRVATVGGCFTRFGGYADAAGVTGAVEAASVETGNRIRDDRLRSEFFEAERFPLIRFESPDALATRLDGVLKIKEIAQPLTLEVAAQQTGDGSLRVLGSTAISRRDYGLEWAALAEAGRLIVSDRVTVELDLVLRPA